MSVTFGIEQCVNVIKVTPLGFGIMIIGYPGLRFVHFIHSAPPWAGLDPSRWDLTESSRDLFRVRQETVDTHPNGIGLCQLGVERMGA